MRQIRAIAAGAALLLLLGLAGYAWWQRGRALALAEDLATARAQVTAFEAAAEVHRATIDRLERVAADAAALDRQLQEGEGADAPLDDYLRAGAGRVWQ